MIIPTYNKLIIVAEPVTFKRLLGKETKVCATKTIKTILTASGTEILELFIFTINPF